MKKRAQSASGQAALLLMFGGAIGLAFLPFTGSATAISYLASAGISVVGLVVDRLPWHRWDERATVPLGILVTALIPLFRFADPDMSVAPYGIWFVLVFAWVGTWHPPSAVWIVAPFATVAYASPFLPGAPNESPDAVVSAFVAIPVAALLGHVIAQKQETMRRMQRSLEYNARLLAEANLTDDLTGLGNRRRGNVLLDSLVPRDAVAVLDLDHFKDVNDTHGHAEGDRILAAFGAYLDSAIREGDAVARFGGEEFLLILRAPRRAVREPIERLLAGWRARCPEVTFSAGVAEHRSDRSPTETFAAADQALYRAKEGGRDRVVLETDPDMSRRAAELERSTLFSPPWSPH